MGRRINELFACLSLKVTNIESGLDRLKSKIDAKAQHAEQEIRNHLGVVRKRIEQDHAKVTAAQADIKTWIEAKKATTGEQIGLWKAKRETAKLADRADKAESYANATIDIVMAALDEAEEAALEAWLARQDANAAEAK